MLTAVINPQAKKLQISYPEFAKMKTEIIDVRSYDEASSVLRSKTLKFICSQIRSFIHMRRFAYEQNGSMWKERERAIEHLQMILDSYGTGSLFRLAKHIANARVSFATLMPIGKSPALSHFNNRIIPIIQYCTEYYQAQA